MYKLCLAKSYRNVLLWKIWDFGRFRQVGQFRVGHFITILSCKKVNLTYWNILRRSIFEIGTSCMFRIRNFHVIKSKFDWTFKLCPIFTQTYFFIDLKRSTAFLKQDDALSRMAVTNEVCVPFLHPLPENSALQKACKKLEHVSKQPHTTKCSPMKCLMDRICWGQKGQRPSKAH